MAKPLRIAFLTPEFVTEQSGLGGLSGYVYRISRALKSMGHDPEVFTLSRNSPGTVDFEGLRVVRVRPDHSRSLRIIRRVFETCLGIKILSTYRYLTVGLGMSRAVAKREKERAFDFVQSSDVLAPGLFVKSRDQRPLIVRCSWARDLWMSGDAVTETFDVRCTNLLERMLIRRAHVAYAPSRFVAEHYSEKYRLNVRTLRPPFLMDVKPAVELSCELPHRFLIHFGTLGPIKGTDVVAAALPIVWREEPSFTLVIAGAARRWTTRGQEFCPDLLTEYSRMWGRLSDRVIWLGEIEKSQLYAVLQRAEAAVLPSRYDNLPNTAIESLSLGVPVIGTRGASIDELVEPGYNGDLVPVGDHHSLAELLLKAWRGQATWIGNGFRQPSIFSQMDPKVAASGLIQLAGFHT